MTKTTRAQMLGKYIVKNKATIRQTASYFTMAKSTVHLDVSGKLKNENWCLYLKVKKILDENWEEKHLRGGFATMKMWQEKKHFCLNKRKRNSKGKYY